VVVPVIEVIHIYSGLESNWELEITDEYFVDDSFGMPFEAHLNFYGFADIEITNEFAGKKIESSSFSLMQPAYLTVTGYDTVAWKFNGADVTNLQSPTTLTLDPDAYSPGRFYSLTVLVTKNRKPYARLLRFYVP
jgi:hypothetical protein